MRRSLALGLALLILGALPAVAAACPRTSLPDVEDEVMCTICGTPLNISESPQAEQERTLIRERIAACDTKAQIKAKLVDQYGEAVLALPKSHGFNRAVYVVPIVAVVAALAALGFFVPRWRRSRVATDGPPVADLPSADATRLDDDIARYDV